MALFGNILKVAAASMIVVTATVMLLEIEIFYDDSPGSSSSNTSGGIASSPRGNLFGEHRDDLIVKAKPSVRLPNEGRLKWEDEGKWTSGPYCGVGC